MGLLNVLLGNKSSPYDGIQFVYNTARYKCNEYYINKNEMKAYSQHLALRIDPMGPMLRPESPLTLVGDLVYLMEIYERADNLKGMVAVANAMKAAENIFNYPGHVSIQFSRTAYMSERVSRHM